MAIDRYSKDYRLTDSLDARGRIRTEMEYIGSYYVFRSGCSAARRAGKRLALCSGISWLAFLAALALPSRAGHALYALLPCAFLALPLWQLSTAGITALRVKEPFVRRDAERLTLRLPAAAVFALILSFAAFLGGFACLVFGHQPPLTGDWVFLGGNLLCFVCALSCRKQTASLTVTPQ